MLRRNVSANDAFVNQALPLVTNIFSSNRISLKSKLKNKNRGYALWNNNKLVGFATVTNPSPNNRRLGLNLIGTIPGKGHGRTLMRAIENNAKKEGLHGVRVMFPVMNAVGFYKKLGYRYPSANEWWSMVKNNNANSAKTKSPFRAVSPPRPKKRSRFM